MSNTKSKAANGIEPMPTPMGSEVVNVLLTAEIAAADSADGDIIILGELPEDCAFVDAVYVADDLDSNGTPALVSSFGVVNADEDGLDTVLQAGLTVGQAAGAVRATLTVAMLELVAAANAPKVLGFEVTTSAATGAAGTLGISLSYRSVHHGA